MRNVLAFARKNYAQLAVQSASTHPTLLPWKQAHPDLKGMLTDIGTRTQTLNLSDRQVEVMNPGFSRFFEGEVDEGVRGAVFGPRGVYQMDVAAPDAEEQGIPRSARRARRRALSPDWVNPRPAGPGGPLSAATDAGLMDRFASADEYSFYQADRFYRRKRPSAAERAKARPDFQDVPPPPAVPEYDFHRIVASYADYGGLMRGLGLVLDFAIEDGSEIEDRVAAGGGEGVGQCQLIVDWDGPPPGKDARPRTAWLARRDRFVPRPRTRFHVAGFLRLQDCDDGWHIHKDERPGLFDLYQVDPDGAAIKTVNFTLSAQNLVGKSLSLRQKHGEVTYTTGDRQSVAALRSCGIGVSQHGRALDLAALAAAADLKNQEIVAGNADKVVLFAEDVLRGYRPDVAEVPDLVQEGKWLTLCARTGEYRLLKTKDVVSFPDDEGYVSGNSVSGDSEGSDDRYLHESLFRWTGWSLAASRPGRTIKAETNDEDELQAEVPSDVTDTAETGNNVAVTFKAAKGSLPRLRFGRLYRMRARIVDLASNSLAPDDPSIGPLEQASDAVGYWRFEPVDPPVLVHRNRISEGESLERMVIRSNHDTSAGEYVKSPEFLGEVQEPAATDFEYTGTNERHVVPPKSSQQQCEVHGLFDPFFGAWDRIKEGYAIAAREAGTLYDPVAGAQIELVTPTANADAATTDTVPPAMPDADNPTGDRLLGGQYILHREAHVGTPYLPDGAAGGVAIRAARGHTIPGVSAPMVLGPSCQVVMSENQHLVILVRRGSDWPGCDGFRLILVERRETHSETPCKVTFPDDGRPDWKEEERTLTLFLPKGHIARLVYSSFVHPDFLRSFGIPRWTDSQQKAEFCMKTAATGTNWLMTPYRNLTLVHATQQPVCVPELENLTPNRGDLGSQTARLVCRTVRLHGPSTGKFEIEAEWDEWVDDPSKARPVRRRFKGQLGEIRLAENHENEFILSEAVSAQLADAEAKRGDVHEFGDTRFRLVKYRARATTRFREYLPPSMYDKPEMTSRLGPVAEGPAFALPAEDDMGAPVLRDPAGSTAQSLVLASAPPKDPRLLYVVPTFRWSERPRSGPYDVTRLGNGLRLWLDRPWFSSGDGELLGVVILAEAGRFTDIPQDMQTLVTQWGLDPLWQTTLPKSLTRETDFPARVAAESVRLQERPAAPPVRIIGHRVHWDDARALWYSDIELEPGASYMPFVRLALVRYQPNAMPQAKTSKVVFADFAQVLPRRRLRVTRAGEKVSVSLHGPNPLKGPLDFTRDSAFQNVSFANGPFETGRNRVELVLQAQEDGLDSDLGWRDETVLAQGVVGADGSAHSSPIATMAEVGARVVRRAAGGTATIPGTVDRGSLTAGHAPSESVLARDITIGAGTIGSIDPFLLDPPFWSATAALPASGAPRRLVVREFERFYSDNTVDQRVGGSTFPRRIIEERLVFADVVDPGSLAPASP